MALNNLNKILKEAAQDAKVVGAGAAPVRRQRGRRGRRVREVAGAARR